MKTPVFRGQRKSNNQWAYGLLGYNPIEGAFYVHEVEDIPPTYENPGGDIYSERFEIKPETIGRFVGLLDKNESEIYDGDIITINIVRDYGFAGKHSKPYIAVIEDRIHSVWFKTLNGEMTDCNWHHYNAEDRVVMGNIHDNPELLKPETV